MKERYTFTPDSTVAANSRDPRTRPRKLGQMHRCRLGRHSRNSHYRRGGAGVSFNVEGEVVSWHRKSGPAGGTREEDVGRADTKPAHGLLSRFSLANDVNRPIYRERMTP